MHHKHKLASAGHIHLRMWRFSDLTCATVISSWAYMAELMPTRASGNTPISIPLAKVHFPIDS